MANLYIRWPATYVSGSVTAVQPNAALLNATVTQGPAATLAGAWTAKITDGVNYAAVKAASVPVAATDPALVVTVSPNATVGVTQSGTWNLNNISGTISLPTGAATSANQTNGTQTTRITDGTNTVAVKAASTAPLATDPALVVAISPNSPVTISIPANGLTGAAVPTYADYIGANKSGTLTGLVMDSASNLLTSLSTTSGAITSTAPGAARGLDVVLKATESDDVFQNLVVAERYNQFEISFTSAPSASLITNTTVGTGGVSYANGQATYTTGATPGGEAKGVSVQSVTYRPGNETHALFSAGITQGNVANYARIGFYDANNGFFLGFEAGSTSFCITKRTATVDTTVNQASFNGDLLNGAAGSKFTLNGSPTALVPSNNNLYRIRFGWLGSANILFDIMSPDGVWVTFHTLKQPNSSTIPSIATPNIPMTVDVLSADATPCTITTACWAAGTSSSYAKITETLTDNSLASLSRSVITGVTTGGGGGYVNVKVTPSGSLVADVTGTVAATQSGTWNINNISGTISLPTGAATSANQTTLGSQTTKINDGTNTAAVKAASTAAVATDPALVVAISPNNTVAATQSGTWNINNVSGTVSLPTGAATSANQTTLGSQTTKINDGTNTAAVKAASTAAVATDPALVVAVSPNNTIAITRKGSTSANAPVYNIYSSSNITTAAYTQLVASTTSATNFIDIFDSSGQAMILATGGAGAETIVAYVPPGGASYQVSIPAGTRVAYKALTANATSGYLLIDFWS